MDDPVLSLYLEEARIATYKSWPFDDKSPCNIKAMAEAGFYKSQNDLDSAKCFLCGKEMDGWEENNDPWEEHVSHAPKCVFAQIRKPEHLLTVAEYLAIVKQHMINHFNEENDKMLTMYDNVIKKYVTKLNLQKK